MFYERAFVVSVTIGGALLVVGAMRLIERAAPTNRVCAIMDAVDPDSKCTGIGRDVGPVHGDIAIVSKNGGSRLCWELFDLPPPAGKGVMACPTLVPTQAEQLEYAKQEAAKELGKKPDPQPAPAKLPGFP